MYSAASRAQALHPILKQELVADHVRALTTAGLLTRRMSWRVTHGIPLTCNRNTNRVCRVNSSVVRLGVVQGEFHWHKHDEDDEFFYVVDGKLLIDLEGRTVELEPKQGFVVPRGAMHRTRAPEKTVILMVENAGIIPTGN